MRPAYRRQNALVSSAFDAVREAIDRAGESDRVAFARATRNAVARAILAAAVAPVAPSAPEREPSEESLRRLVGPDLAVALAALYRGDDDWTSRAIDVLAPLNERARASA
jgi:hypothetical protein